MNCSASPLLGMLLAVAITVPPPPHKRFTMASPIPLLPPVTRIRLPVNSFVLEVFFDDAVIAGASERKTVAARSEKSGVTVSCLLDACKKLMRCVDAAVTVTLGVVSVFHGHAGSRCFDNVQGRAVA